MKVLVTGANGYLGKGVVKALLDDGHEVVSAIITDQYVDQRSQIVKADIFSLENPYEFFGKPDVLVHMAWRDGFVHNASSHIDDLPKHVNFLKRIIDGGIKQVAVMGSMHEVGFYEGSINENTPCNPASLYGISKNALRSIVQLQCKDKCVYQWLRGFYIVGATEDGGSIFSKIVKTAHQGQKEFPFTMGLNQYDYLDYEDFCQKIADAVTQSEVDGIINIASGRPEKLADRVERFIKENNFDIKLNYGAFPDRPYDSKAIWGDDKKIALIQKNKERRNG